MNNIHTKIAKNLSVMRRVKWLLNGTTLYTLYCSLVLPYMGYCCEIWRNTYKHRIQPLYITETCNQNAGADLGLLAAGSQSVVVICHSIYKRGSTYIRVNISWLLILQSLH